MCTPDEYYCLPTKTRKVFIPSHKKGWKGLFCDNKYDWIDRKCNRCGLMKSLRSGSFFEGSKLSLQRHVQILWKWAQKDSSSTMFFEGIASRKVLIKMARKCREVAWQAPILQPIPRLGRPVVIIQIDESNFNQKSKVSKKGLNNLVSSQYCHCRVLIW